MLMSRHLPSLRCRCRRIFRKRRENPGSRFDNQLPLLDSQRIDRQRNTRRTGHGLPARTVEACAMPGTDDASLLQAAKLKRSAGVWTEGMSCAQAEVGVD